MKTLRELLEEELPKILPENPDEAINGTSLIKEVKSWGDFHDANDFTLRMYFSLMAADSTSVLAKRPGKHGYYLRLKETEDTIPDSIKTEKGDKGKQFARDEQREEKFRSIFMRHSEFENYSVMKIEHTKGIKKEKGWNKWKFPDVILVKWEVGEFQGKEFRLSSPLLEVRKSLGEQPFKLYSNELKTEVRVSNLRESFFQCVSNSKWAHRAQFVVAAEIKDSTLEDELSRLGRSYDVTIISFGMNLNNLDKLPSASEILKMDQGKFEEKFNPEINIKVITTGKEKESLDWEHLKDMQTQSDEFKSLIEWISKCLTKRKLYKYEDFEGLHSIEKKYKK